MLRQKKPSSSFCCYRTDVLDEFAEQNPDKTMSELNSIIVDSWNGLDIETKTKYEKQYEGLLDLYNQSSKDPTLQANSINEENNYQNKAGQHNQTEKDNLTDSINNPEATQESRYLTNIFKKYEMHENVCHFGWLKGISSSQYNNSHEFHVSLDDAKNFIKEEYIRHLDEYATYFKKYQWEKVVQDEVHSEYTASYRYYCIEEVFDATIFDFKTSQKIEVSEETLRSEIKARIERMPTIIKFLTMSILRKKGFNPRAIRDVILISPEIKISKDAAELWEKKLQSRYPERDGRLILG